MINTKPNLYLKLSGKGNITEYENTKLFDVREKLEQNYLLNNADGVVNLNFEQVENLRYIVLSSDTNFELSITTALESITMITDLFVLTPSTTFASDITGLSIQATSPDVKQNIAVRLYGV